MGSMPRNSTPSHESIHAVMLYNPKITNNNDAINGGTVATRIILYTLFIFISPINGEILYSDKLAERLFLVVWMFGINYNCVDLAVTCGIKNKSFSLAVTVKIKFS